MPKPVPAAERRERRKRAPAIASQTLARLAKQHPTAHCELDFVSPFQLVVAVVLSAQTTDVNVNKATPELFARFPDARALAAVEPREVEPYVASLGFFRMKSKSIVGLARGLVDKHGGEVPQTMEELVALPGVGRKTANVVLGVLWNKPEGVVVDTHVQRLAQRLGWSRNKEPEKIERDLCTILPRNEWDMTGHVLIFHGRRCCYARKPDCPSCSVTDVCPSAFDAEHVGRKAPGRPRGLPGAKPGAKPAAKPGAKAAAKLAKKAAGARKPVRKPVGALARKAAASRSRRGR